MTGSSAGENLPLQIRFGIFFSSSMTKSSSHWGPETRDLFKFKFLSELIVIQLPKNFATGSVFKINSFYCVIIGKCLDYLAFPHMRKFSRFNPMRKLVGSVSDGDFVLKKTTFGTSLYLISNSKESVLPLAT